MATLQIRFVLRITPKGVVSFYRENKDTTLGEAFAEAKQEQVTGDIIKVIALTIPLPPDPERAKEPPIDINITV